MNALLAFLYRNKEKVLPNIELSRFPPLRWLRAWIRRRMRQDSVEIAGHKIFLDPNDSLDLSIAPDYEPELTALIQKETREGDVVVDIGANIGYYTLLLARKVGPNGRVIAFEPDPVNFGVLQRNIQANGYKNVVAVNKAVSDKAATAKLFLAPGNLGDHRIFDPGDGRKSIEIETVVLDEFLAGMGVKKVNVMKMDIQGAELYALRGMKSTLTANKLTLFMEFWPYGLFKSGVEPEAVLQFLREVGFSLRDVASPGTPVPQERFDGLLKRSRENNPRHVDLICKRD